MAPDHLKNLGVDSSELPSMKKTAAEKIAIAWLIRSRTCVSQGWIAERLQMGHPVNVSSFCLKIDRAQKPLVPNVDRATKLIENLRSLT